MQRVSARLQRIGRSLSERSALSPGTMNEENSYGSFLLSLGGFRQSLRRSASYQVNRPRLIEEFRYMSSITLTQVTIT